ncbi:hypothetical protein ACFL20_09810 [Spirochaetota bacterium]
MLTNKLINDESCNELNITIIDHIKDHYYQPGFLFIPFDIYGEKYVYKSRKDCIPGEVKLVTVKAEVIEVGNNRIVLENGENIDIPPASELYAGVEIIFT